MTHKSEFIWFFVEEGTTHVLVNTDNDGDIYSAAKRLSLPHNSTWLVHWFNERYEFDGLTGSVIRLNVDACGQFTSSLAMQHDDEDDV